jgi:hypothetical protein
VVTSRVAFVEIWPERRREEEKKKRRNTNSLCQEIEEKS